MPNTGKPSPACHLCRTRRVKCDLKQPGCLRCVKVGTSCPGYRDEQDLLFHNQSKLSYATKSRRSRGRGTGVNDKSSPCSTSDGSPSSAPDQSSHAGWMTHAGIPPRMVEDWNTYSIPVVLNQFSAPSDRSLTFGYFDCLLELYRETNNDPESCLGLATSSVAKAYITTLSDSSPNRIEHLQTHMRALRATCSALEDPCERLKDSTLVAVWLLSAHELLSRSPGKSHLSTPAPLSWHMHSEGILSLLRTRGAHQFSTRRGRNLFWVMYFFIQIHCLTITAPCPPEFLEWLELLGIDTSKDVQQALTHSYYIYRISALCSRILPFCRSSQTESDQQEFYSLLAEADAVQQDVLISTTINPTQLPSHFTPKIVNLFRAALVKLQQFIIMLIDRAPLGLAVELHSRRELCIEITYRFSRQILDSVPVLLGEPRISRNKTPPRWADGLRLLWPLIVVSWVIHGLPEHRREAQLVLQRIGRELQIAVALHCEPPAGRFIDSDVLSDTTVRKAD